MTKIPFEDIRYVVDASITILSRKHKLLSVVIPCERPIVRTVKTNTTGWMRSCSEMKKLIIEPIYYNTKKIKYAEIGFVGYNPYRPQSVGKLFGTKHDIKPWWISYFEPWYHVRGIKNVDMQFEGIQTSTGFITPNKDDIPLLKLL